MRTPPSTSAPTRPYVRMRSQSATDPSQTGSTPLRPEDLVGVVADGPATLLEGRYRLIDLLGEGGMSAVYGAYDTLLERPVALKMLHVNQNVPHDVLVREARVLAAVRHPNVVAVHAFHEANDPPFLVMDHIDGTSLDVLAREKRPTLHEALGYLRQIADGLDAIHAVGLVHGDIKPSNVLVDRSGRLFVIDVGLVPMLERASSQEAFGIGTPAYMAPERALGAVVARAMGPRSDVYSFAVLAFELLTGTRPLEAAPPPRDGATPRVALPPSVPSEVSELARVFDEPFERALSRTALARPASAGAFVDALERAALAVDARGRALGILVVDDEPSARTLLTVVLGSRLRGVEIETVNRGAAALEAIARRAPSVMIVDLQMPGIAGAELVRAALAIAPGLRIIVCTGHGSGPEWRELKEFGVRHFFVKPVETDDLVRAIRELVDGTPKRDPRRLPV